MISKNKNQPIFIVGTPRSGTTLIASILGNHETIFAPAPGESHFFHDVWTRRNDIGDLSNQASFNQAAALVLNLFNKWDNPPVQHLVDQAFTQKVLYQRYKTIGSGYGALYLAFTELLAESQGKVRYCDDTPKHLFYLQTIFNYFPDAKVIGCIRDPRDFLCSYKYYWRKAFDPSRIKPLYHPLITSLLWRGSTNILLKHAYNNCKDRVIVLQYEKLVQNPEKEVKRICKYLNISYYDELLNINKNNSSFDDPKRSNGIFKSAIGRWRTCITKEEASISQVIAKKNMELFNYKIEDINPESKIEVT